MTGKRLFSGPGRQAALPWPRGLPETGKWRLAGVPLPFYFYVGRHFVFCAFPVVWCVEQFSTLTAQFPLLFPLFSLRNAFGRV